MTPDLITLGIEILAGTALAFTITAQQVAGIVISLALGVLQQLLFKRKGPRASTPVDRRNLNEMDPQPAYLAAYGNVRLGRFITERRTLGRTIYLQLLVQSRPSAGPWGLYLDNRYVPLSGDPTDFDGPGALSYDPDPVAWPHADLLAGYVRCWFGYGDQTTIPADLLAEVPEMADAPVWPGMSVVWVACALGPDATARDRWPNAQPTVAVEGPMALVYDPRDPAQDPDDPATWVYSDNQALVTLDMVRHEHCFAAADAWHAGTFIAGADICDEPVAVKGGGTEPRYRVAGTWEADGATPGEMIEPCLLAGMADIAEVDGEWRYFPGKYLPPEVTWSEDVMIGPAAELVDERDPADMANIAQVQFVDPSRNWELQPLPDLVDPDAVDADNGVASPLPVRLEWVPYVGQAFRIGWRSIQVTRFEREINGSFKAAALRAHYGARIALDMQTIWGGTVEFFVGGWTFGVEEVDPELGTSRLTAQMVLRETGPGVDDYDPEAQPELAEMIRDESLLPVQPPVIDDVVAETTTTAGGTVINARVTCDQSPTASATEYHPRWKIKGPLGIYAHSYGAPVSADELADGDQFSFVIGPLELNTYEVEVRTRSPRGWSDWVLEEFTITEPTDPPPAPTLVAGATGTDHTVTWRTPDDVRHERLVLWESATNSFAAATETESIGTFPDTEVVNVGSGAPGVPVYYWATSRDVWGVDSDPAGPAVHTTP